MAGWVRDRRRGPVRRLPQADTVEPGQLGLGVNDKECKQRIITKKEGIKDKINTKKKDGC